MSEVETATVPGGEFKIQPTVVDVKVVIAEGQDIDQVIASPGFHGRLAGLFVRLTRLAREDERLAELLRDYAIEIDHGPRRLWP